MISDSLDAVEIGALISAIGTLVGVLAFAGWLDWRARRKSRGVPKKRGPGINRKARKQRRK